eukprot:CAMPEP_0170592346 /NCGR_PEP_ID=MMETSP0224-20130122/12876_1 /TAXON_ID=285029 /ORGANISM="Togula jolla, Strain CCCM 725" /LENGTH=48 /DNA_ID= /DNA_START= /DNA_END= /DNA_ORIENTATION=
MLPAGCFTAQKILRVCIADFPYAAVWFPSTVVSDKANFPNLAAKKVFI